MPRVITKESSREGSLQPLQTSLQRHYAGICVKDTDTGAKRDILSYVREKRGEGEEHDGGGDGEPSGNAENIFADFPAFQKRSRSRARCNMKVAYGSLRMSIKRSPAESRKRIRGVAFCRKQRRVEA